MGLVEDFIARYRKEYDFYDQAARLLAQIREGRLQGAGIRAMVTSRAKTVGRLEAKVRKRNSDKHYSSMDDIYGDIVDLAGVRVALYFPGERSQVDSIIKSLFFLPEPQKDFPSTRVLKRTQCKTQNQIVHLYFPMFSRNFNFSKKAYGFT